MVEIHSETKSTAGPTCKGSFDFHLMSCFANATGECLSSVLRPGNAGPNTTSDDLEVLDSAMRAEPVDDCIQCLKDSESCRFPFATGSANGVWLFAVAMATDLVRRFQLPCLGGRLAVARSNALRWSFLHACGRLVRSCRRLVVRVFDHCPTAPAILGAHARLATIT